MTSALYNPRATPHQVEGAVISSHQPSTTAEREEQPKHVFFPRTQHPAKVFQSAAVTSGLWVSSEPARTLVFVCQWPLVMSRVASELLKFFVGNQSSQAPSQTFSQAGLAQGTSQGSRTATSKPIPVSEAQQAQPRPDRANKVWGSNDCAQCTATTPRWQRERHS